jgi:hypothetical protein
MFALIAVTLAAWATTTLATAEFLRLVRGAVLLPIAILCVAALYSHLRLTVFAAGTLMWAMLVAYAALTAMMEAATGGPSAVDLILVLVIPLAFHFLFTAAGPEIISTRVLALCVLFTHFAFIVTVANSGFVFGPPPRFVFEAAAFGAEGNLSYSLGASRLYGMGAVVSALLSRAAQGVGFRTYCWLSAALFIVLCVIAGGRGEILIAGTLLVLALGLSRIYLLVAILCIFAVATFDSFAGYMSSEFAVFDRFAYLGTSLGMRDILLMNSIDLLTSEPRCAAFGCGFSYFEHYHGYPPGLYPHNFVAEFIITFGVPAFILLCVLGSKGAAVLLKGRSNRNFLFIAGFVFLVGLKSGSLLQAWLLIGCCLHAASVGAVSMLYRNGGRRPPGNMELRNGS